MRKSWFSAATLVLAVVVPGRARAQAAQLDTGLILSTVEQAAAKPVTHWQDFSLEVDLSDRVLKLYSGDQVVRSYPVSVGQEGYATPPGTYHIAHIVWNPSWTPPDSPWAKDHHREPPGAISNPMGRVKLFFREPDLYLHGTYLPSSLGNARSHGCIRLRNVDAVELAKIVMVNGGSTKDHAWYVDTIDKSDTSREVELPHPVLLRVQQ